MPSPYWPVRFFFRLDRRAVTLLEVAFIVGHSGLLYAVLVLGRQDPDNGALLVSLSFLTLLPAAVIANALKLRRDGVLI